MTGPPPNALAPVAGTGTRVLVVEDDPGIATQLARGLARAGYEVTVAATGEQAVAAVHPDVVILDLGLPDVDGLDVCRRLHRAGDTGIIVVTARSEEPERVAALDAGADDYVVKPFGFSELLARIRALQRRRQPASGALLRHGTLVVDSRARRVSLDGREVGLTGKEFDILECLAVDPGRVVSRDEIFQRAWGGPWYGPSKVIDVHVAALRRKLGAPELVETVYGRGFRLGTPP